MIVFVVPLQLSLFWSILSMFWSSLMLLFWSSLLWISLLLLFPSLCRHCRCCQLRCCFGFVVASVFVAGSIVFINILAVSILVVDPCPLIVMGFVFLLFLCNSQSSKSEIAVIRHTGKCRAKSGPQRFLDGSHVTIETGKPARKRITDFLCKNPHDNIMTKVRNCPPKNGQKGAGISRFKPVKVWKITKVDRAKVREVTPVVGPS